MAIKSDITRSEAAKRKTDMGKNYNGGKYVNPYMSDKPSDVWGGVAFLLCFIVIPLLVL